MTTTLMNEHIIIQEGNNFGSSLQITVNKTGHNIKLEINQQNALISNPTI